MNRYHSLRERACAIHCVSRKYFFLVQLGTIPNNRKIPVEHPFRLRLLWDVVKMIDFIFAVN